MPGIAPGTGNRVVSRTESLFIMGFMFCWGKQGINNFKIVCNIISGSKNSMKNLKSKVRGRRLTEGWVFQSFELKE